MDASEGQGAEKSEDAAQTPEPSTSSTADAGMERSTYVPMASPDQVLDSWTNRLKGRLGSWSKFSMGMSTSPPNGGKDSFSRRSSLSPETLPDHFEVREYEVLKLNNFRDNGHIMNTPRILRLSLEAVENIKLNGSIIEVSPQCRKVTKSHPYGDITAIYLKAQDKFVISYRNDHEFVYSSNSARVIVDDIQRRVVAVQSLERERKGVASHRMQTASTEFSSVELQSNGSGLKANGVSKVQALLGVSEKERLRGNVDSILLDNLTPEGRTLAQFLANYRQTSLFGHDQGGTAAEGSNPRINKLHTFRKGMVKYIMDNRLEEIRRGNFGDNIVEDNEDVPLPQELERMLSEEAVDLKDIRDPSIDYSESSRASQVSRALRASRASGDSSASQGRIHRSSMEMEDYINHVIKDAVEAAVIMPVLDEAWAALETDRKHEERLVKFIQKLQSEHQSFYGIPTGSQSGTGWHSAVFELSQIDRERLPSRKLKAILSAAHAVHFEHQRLDEMEEFLQAENDDSSAYPRPPPAPSEEIPSTEVAAGEPGGSTGGSHGIANSKREPLSADDFLPIFIFVVVQAAPEAPCRTQELLWALGGDRELQGESGYYLTMYEAAISYLGKQMKAMHLPPEPEPPMQLRAGLARQSSISVMVGNWSTPTSTQAAADKEDRVVREVTESSILVNHKDMIL